MATIIVAVVFALPLLALSAQIVARRKISRRQPEPGPPPPTAEDAEALATRLLIAGAISRAEYRHAMATLAVSDEIEHPVRIPQR